MDHPLPDPPPEPASPEQAVAAPPERAVETPPERTVETPGTELAAGAPTATKEERTGARLQRLVGADETVVAWTQCWVSRQVRLHRVLAARTLDFAVVTDRSLQLFSTGFFTRRARRRVYNTRFERIFVASDDVRRGRRRLRVSSRDAKPLWFELDGSKRAVTFATELLDRTRIEQP